MKRRFVVLLDSATPEQDEKFKEWVKKQGFAYWHWLSQSWLLTSPDRDVMAVDIRTNARKIYNGCHLLVLELKETGHDTWAGFGPSSEKTNMFRWIRKNWS